MAGAALAEAKQCPWCGRWALKDASCNYVFGCGLTAEGFVVGAGCGKSWCWRCGKKFCGVYCDPRTGALCPGRKESHDALCCKQGRRTIHSQLIVSWKWTSERWPKRGP
jgi:hypothetical protein